MKFSAITIAMALSLSKLACAETSAEGTKTSSTQISYNTFFDKNCTVPLSPTDSVSSWQALGDNLLCSNWASVGSFQKITIKCDNTELKGYEDYFLLSYKRCYDNNCRNCSDTVYHIVEPKTSHPTTLYSCDPMTFINIATGEQTSPTFYYQFNTTPEVMAAYNKFLSATCIGDYVESSSSSSTPTDTVATTNETEGMLNDGSGANTGVEGGSSVASIAWGLSSFVVLATAGLSIILLE